MKPAHPAPPRPFATFYYKGLRTSLQDWSRIGHASTLRGAIRAAVVRLYDRAYDKATVYDEDGVAYAHLTRRPSGIQILGVFDVPR